MSRTVDLWLDLRSPYSFLAKDPAYARRFAGPRGLTILEPKKIFDPKLAHLAWLWAEQQGRGRALVDLAYPRFFKREIDYEDRGAIEALIREAGADPSGFDSFAADDGPKALTAHQEEVEGQGVFAVPTFVIDGELFWGQDRIEFGWAKLRG